MNNQQFVATLEELFIKIEENMKDIINQAHHLHNQEKLKRSVALLSDSIGTMRVALQYILLDLEATRRERDKLRMLLEDQD